MIYRFTGPPENWLTAAHRRAWAVNEHNKRLWSEKFSFNDIAIFHSTAKSEFSGAKPISSVIGFGYIDHHLFEKSDYWWHQEISDQQNYWPYVVPFKEMYFFSNIENIDLELDVAHKENSTVTSEIVMLLSNAIPISVLNKTAVITDPAAPRFPVNGSASRINPVYEELVLDSVNTFFPVEKNQQMDSIEERLAQDVDSKISAMSDSEILKEANSFVPPPVSEKSQNKTAEVRKESQKQKRLIGKLYNYSCQICGFHSEYVRRNGKPGYILEVDHIIPKSEGGTEKASNLWALCPNCHSKKTRGIIKIETNSQTVSEKGKAISITDKHLFI